VTEVTEDALGELPLCAKHLKKVRGPWAGRPASLVRKSISSLASYAPALPRHLTEMPVVKPQKPFGLTEREMQVATRSHLPRRKIAEQCGSGISGKGFMLPIALSGQISCLEWRSDSSQGEIGPR